MITEADHTDIPALADMLRDLNALHIPHAPHRLHGTADHSALCAMFHDAFEQGARALITRTEGVARGYLLWKIETRAASAVTRPLTRAVLDHIYVEPAWRRRGVGQRMVQRFERDSADAGCAGWISHVFASNVGSQALMVGQGANAATQSYEKIYRAS